MIAGRSISRRLAILAAVAASGACAGDDRPPPPGGPLTHSAEAAVPPTGVEPPKRFTGRDAAERLRERAVGWALAEKETTERLADTVVVLRSLPEGHPSERVLLEGIAPTLAARDPEASRTQLARTGNRVAERWLARGETAPARTVVRAMLELGHVYDEEMGDLAMLVDRLDGRDAALALAARTDEAELRRHVARAEARYGDFRWAAEVARVHDDVKACAIWSALVVRHARDGRSEAAREAWDRARRAADLKEQAHYPEVRCLIEFARAAASVGEHDEVARAFATLPEARTWPACSVLAELGSELDPLLLDVPVAIVALRRDEVGPPVPSCPLTAAWIAGRSGAGALARSLRSRAVVSGGGRLGGMMNDWAFAFVAEVASGDADPLEARPGQPFRLEWLPAMVELYGERPDEVVDEARFEARFPASTAPWHADPR